MILPDGNEKRITRLSTRQYVVSYGLVGFCGRFRSSQDAELARGQLALLRTHRGVELGQVLWPVNEFSSGLTSDKHTPALRLQEPVGDILRVLVDGDSFLEQHRKRVRDMLAWMEGQLAVSRDPGVICDLEYLYEPARLGVLYLGLLPDNIARFSVALERQFGLRAEWYDASEWLDADQAWEERTKAGPRPVASESASERAKTSCGQCSCSRQTPSGCEITRSHGDGARPRHAESLTGCTSCVIRKWFCRSQ